MRSPNRRVLFASPAVALLALSLAASAGCGRSALLSAELNTEPEFSDASDDAVFDANVMDTQNDPTDRPDVLEPAPEIPTPNRSAAVDDLYCGLDNGHIVQAALRGGACLDLSVAGVLLDAAHGFVYGPMMQEGYFNATYGNCDFLRCLSNADTCRDARQCQAERIDSNACSIAGERRCDGDHLEVCIRDVGDVYFWTRTQDCSRMPGECVEVSCGDDPDCRETAFCSAETMTAECDYYGSCDGDTLIRCAGEFAFEPEQPAARIDCGELADGATCVYEPVGGEAPGPICTVENQDCSNSFGEGFGCIGRVTAALCLFGRIVEVDCTDYGYSRCEDLDFEGVRCVP